MAQARFVAAQLRERHGPGLDVAIVEIETSGDLDRVSPVAALTEMGAFVRAVQHAVLDGRADAAVHSLKDLPTVPVPGLVAAAYPVREDPADVLVGARLEELADGAVIGTGSPRRIAQLQVLRPGLTTREVRGNVDTRIGKVATGEVDAVVLAAAGLRRLGRGSDIVEVFGPDLMVPAPGQGTLVVETRTGGPHRELVAAIDDPGVRASADAERSLLAATGAGCRSALGALATRESGDIRMQAFVADERGARRADVIADPEAITLVVRRELGI
jgi:hydroxymethylbilane synthase